MVISRSSPNPSVTETTEVQGMLEDFTNLSLANSVVRDRIAFRKAARAGRSVPELEPEDPKASGEIKDLYKEVFGDN